MEVRKELEDKLHKLSSKRVKQTAKLIKAQEKLEAVEREFNSVKDKISTLEEDLTKNRFYTLNTNKLAVVKYKGDGSGLGFGVDMYSQWNENIRMSDPKQWRLSTDTEVKRMLMSQIESRGYVKGSTITDLKTGNDYIASGTVVYEANKDFEGQFEVFVYSRSKSNKIYLLNNDGEWAKVEK